jgi:hypothetical protein
MSNDSLIQIQELIDNAMSSLKTANAMLRDLTGVADASRDRLTARASRMATPRRDRQRAASSRAPSTART